MGKVKHDYTLLNFMKWAAWGVIDIEKLDRHQRRNYINHVREELKLHGCVLECGGRTSRSLHYSVTKPATETHTSWTETAATYKGEKAFSAVCRRALTRLDPDAEEAISCADDPSRPWGGR